MKGVAFVSFVSIASWTYTIYYHKNLDFYTGIDIWIGVYAALDLILSNLVAMFAIMYSKIKYDFVISYVEEHYLESLKSNKKLLLLILAYTAYLGISSFFLSISGVARHELLNEYDAAGIDYLFLGGLFKALFLLSWYFNGGVFLRIISTTGLIFVTMITASRSELAHVVYFFVVCISIAYSVSGIYKLIFIPAFLSVSAVMITIFLQNRPGSDMNIISSLVDTVMRYRLYPMYLSEYSMAAASSIEKIFYPFFGYFAEYPMSKIFSLENPINTEFVIKFHVIGENSVFGNEYLANVIYPWWSWFVGVYGPLGLIIKGIYLFLIIRFLLAKRLYLAGIFFLTQAYFGNTSTHPFMLVSNILTLLVFVLVDLYAKRGVRRINRSCRS